MRQTFKRVLTLTLVLLSFCVVVFESGAFDLEVSAATTYYEAIEEEVVLRAGPSSDYDIKQRITKGTVVKVVSSTTNSSGNLWYKLSNGYYVFSDRVTKHTHSYSGGICTNTTCKYEWPYTVTSVSRTVVVTNADGCPYYNRPYSNNSTKYGTYAKNTVLTITGETKNQAGNPWYKTSSGYWIYAGNVTTQYTLKYNANGGTGAPPSQTFLSGKTFKLSGTKPTRVGYIFMGWSSTSTSYASNTAYHPAGGNYTATSNVTLNAIWKKCSHSSYTGGICDNCSYEYPCTVTSITATVVVTNADGCAYYNRPYSKKSTKYGVYPVNKVLSISATTTNQEGNPWCRTSDGYWLYTGNVTQRFTVNYNANGGLNPPSGQTFLSGKTLTLSKVQPTRVGYIFQGWGTSASDTSVDYKPGASYSAKKSITLYAIWKKCSDHTYSGGICSKCTYEYPLTITDYNCTFVVTNAEGAKVWSRPYSNNSTHLDTYAYGEVCSSVKKTVNQAGNTWYQLSNGKWIYSGNIERGYWVIYNINCTNGSNNPIAVAKTMGTTFQLSTKKPTRSGYTFLGWSTTSTGSVKYKAGANYTVKGTATLYAVWAKNATITSNPSTVYTKAGSTAKFAISATGTGLAYQWQYRTSSSDSWKNCSGCTTKGINVSATTARHGYQYRCVIKDDYGNKAYSAAATLNVLGITSQPKTAYAKNGDKVSASVTATGAGLTYKWYIADPGDTYMTVSSLTSNTYSTTMNSIRAGRKAYCVITDKAGNTVTTNTVYLRMKASITTQPSTTYAKSGAIAKTTVSALGDGLTYTWYIKNAGGTSYVKSSVTSATYSCKMTSATHDRYAYCVVTDKYGYTERTKTVALRRAATITKQPKSASAASGEVVKTKVTAVGEDLTYTWYIKNAGGMSYVKSSVTSATYSCKMSSTTDGRKAYCVVTDKYGKKAKSNVVKLSME